MMYHRFVISTGALSYAILGVSMLHNPKEWFFGSSEKDQPKTDHQRAQINLQIEKNSTLLNDITRIWHEPKNYRVCVQLKRNARCPHPALLGRLSGPSLALLEWKDANLKSGGNVLCGSYGDQWLDSGEYFLEIIAIFCDDFGFKALSRGKHMHDWFNESFVNKCVEDAERNRITSKESRITVPESTRGAGNFRIGRWKRRPDLPSRPIFTRYQPADCVEPKGGNSSAFRLADPLPEHCPIVTDRDTVNETTGTYEGLPEYDFQWGTSNQWGMNNSKSEIVSRLQDTFITHKQSLPKICAIGDSHSRFVVNRSVKYLGVRGIMTFIKHQWPNATGIKETVQQKGCEIVFIQIGQWPAGFTSGGNPWTFGKYYKGMKELVKAIRRALRDVPGSKVYLPTVDMGPLMGAINRCKDWRTPTVMRSYSYLLQKIASEESKKGNVEFLDTAFIIQNHWDADPDWLHLPEDVRYHKTLYFLVRILGDIGHVFCEECLEPSELPSQHAKVGLRRR